MGWDGGPALGSTLANSSMKEIDELYEPTAFHHFVFCVVEFMSSRRRSSIIRTAEVPLDCWSVVVRFLKDKKDFLSLILSIKDLYGYISRNPICTENIIVKLNSLPNEPVSHVSNINILNEQEENSITNLPRFLSNYRCQSAKELFENCLKLFPTCSRIQFGLAFKITKDIYSLDFFEEVLCSRTCFCDFCIQQKKINGYCGDYEARVFGWPLQQLHLTELNCIHTTLKRMNITLSMCNLTINSPFPFVESLILNSIGHYRENDDYFPGNLGNFTEFYDLDVDFASSFPQLKHLELFGWNVKSDMGALKNTLKVLDLDMNKFPQQQENDENSQNSDNVTSSSIILDGYSQLTDIVLRYKGMSTIKDLKNLSSLQTLRMIYRSKVEDQWIISRGPVKNFSYFGTFDNHFHGKAMISFDITELPNLTFITFEGEDSQFKSEREDTDPLQISYLPNLRRLEMISLNENVLICGCPKLVHVKSMFQVSNYPDLDDKEAVVTLDMACSTEGNLRYLYLDDRCCTRDVVSCFDLMKHSLETIHVMEQGEGGALSSGLVFDPRNIISFEDFECLKILKFVSKNTEMRVQRVKNLPMLKELVLWNPKRDFEISGVPLLEIAVFEIQRYDIDEWDDEEEGIDEEEKERRRGEMAEFLSGRRIREQLERECRNLRTFSCREGRFVWWK